MTSKPDIDKVNKLAINIWNKYQADKPNIGIIDPNRVDKLEISITNIDKG